MVVAELRGLGAEASRIAARPQANPLGGNPRDAFLSLHIGRPLLGQRVYDLLCLLHSLRAQPELASASGFELAGTGPAGPAVLHAAALDANGLIKQVTISHSLISFVDVVERGISRNQLDQAVPGVLAYYDLPDLAVRMAPLPLRIENPTSAVGSYVSRSELEAAYASCLRAYGNDRNALVLQAAP